MTTNPLLGRVIEIAATYLIHSTVLLGLAWIFLHCVSRRGTKSNFPHPGTVEATWKLAALLPLLTAPFCVQANLGSRYLTCAMDFGSSITQPPSLVHLVEPNEGEAVRIAAQEYVPAEPTELIESAEDEGLQSYSELVAIAAANSSDHPSPRITEASPSSQFEESTASEPTLTSNIVEPTPLELPTRSRVGRAHHINPNVIELIAITFFVWIAIQLCRLAWLAVSLQRWLRRCDPLPACMSEQLEQIVPHGMSVRLLQASDFHSRQCVLPFACGVLQPSIVLPQKIELQLSATQLRALLAHEIAHLVRRDPLWQWIGQFLCTCLAIQPLNFAARSRWQQAAELLCDDWAIEQKIAPTELAHCLTRIAEWRINASTKRQLSLGVPAVGNIGALTNRVEWLLRRRSNSSRYATHFRVVFVSLALLLGATFGTTGPRFVLIPKAAVFAQERADDVVPIESSSLDEELDSAEREFAALQQLLKPIGDPQIEAALSGIQRRLQQIKSELPK